MNVMYVWNLHGIEIKINKKLETELQTLNLSVSIVSCTILVVSLISQSVIIMAIILMTIILLIMYSEEQNI